MIIQEKGKHWDEEHKKQMSEIKKNDDKAMQRIIQLGKENSKSVNQYDLEGNYIKTFNKILDAEEETGTSHTIIIRCCKRKDSAKTAGGFQWRYTDDCEDIGKVKYKKKSGRPRSVYQYDKDMNLLKTWDSMTMASQELNINVSNIIEVCRGGRQKTAGGYIWRYVDK